MILAKLNKTKTEERNYFVTAGQYDFISCKWWREMRNKTKNKEIMNGKEKKCTQKRKKIMTFLVNAKGFYGFIVTWTELKRFYNGEYNLSINLNFSLQELRLVSACFIRKSCLFFQRVLVSGDFLILELELTRCLNANVGQLNLLEILTTWAGHLIQ